MYLLCFGYVGKVSLDALNEQEKVKTPGKMLIQKCEEKGRKVFVCVDLFSQTAGREALVSELFVPS